MAPTRIIDTKILMNATGVSLWPKIRIVIYRANAPRSAGIPQPFGRDRAYLVDGYSTLERAGQLLLNISGKPLRRALGCA